MTHDETISKEAQEAADKFDIRGCAAHQGYLRGYIAGSKKVEELREVVSELVKLINENEHQLWLNDIEWAIIDRAKKLV